MIKVFVGMPNGDGKVSPDTILNIFNQNIDRNTVEIVFNMSGVIQRAPIHIARNRILEQFIRSGCDYLWFVDDDNPPMLDVLQKLLESQKDIVSAIVPLRMYDKEGQSLNVFYDDMNGYIKNYDKIPTNRDPLQEISNCGTGCVLLSKRVCFDMWRKYSTRAFWFTTDILVYNHQISIAEQYIGQDQDEGWEDIYKSDSEGNISKINNDVSEDLNFFRRAKEMDYKIYVRRDAECYHYNGIPSKRIINEHFIPKK